MRKVYLDGAATTPLDKDVLKAMRPYLSQKFVGNSMSTHFFGIEADKAVYGARQTIANCLRVKDSEVYFTSGATESNNWAIMSVVREQIIKNGGDRHIICSTTEHDSVLKACQMAEKLGMTVSYVTPSNKKFIRYEDILPLIRVDTRLICVMAVNNELGTANEIEKITDLAKQRGILTLVDCTQVMSYGGKYCELGKNYPKATFFSFSSHKLYGPGGVGCLIARQNYKLTPLIVGGAQESGLRGGTSNTAGIVGMAAAINKLHEEEYEEIYESLFNSLTEKLKTELPLVTYNAIPSHYNIISLNCSKYVSVKKLADELSYCGVAVSAGSACDAEHDETKGDFNGSHVLLALGLTEQQIRNTIRISFTKFTREKDLDELILAIKEVKASEK